jgi:hypothetical protein
MLRQFYELLLKIFAFVNQLGVFSSVFVRQSKGAGSRALRHGLPFVKTPFVCDSRSGSLQLVQGFAHKI